MKVTLAFQPERTWPYLYFVQDADARVVHSGKASERAIAMRQIEWAIAKRDRPPLDEWSKIVDRRYMKIWEHKP